MENQIVSVESPTIEAVLKLDGSTVKFYFKPLKSREVKKFKIDYARVVEFSKKENISDADKQEIERINEEYEDLAFARLERIDGELKDVDGTVLDLKQVKERDISIFLEGKIKELYKRYNSSLATISEGAEAKNGQPQDSQSDGIKSLSNTPDLNATSV